LQKLGWQVDVIGLGEGFPRPDAATKSAARDKLAGLAKEIPIIVDGLALGVLPEAAKELREQHLLLALVHHPLALETGLVPGDVQALRTSEYDALAAVRGVVVNSPSTSQLLVDDYDVPPDLITIALPGTDRGDIAEGSSDGIVRLVSVGSVVPRKGFDVLVEALAPLKSLPWRLTIAGDLTRDEATATQLEADITRHELADRIDIVGVLSADGIAELYVASDVFVLASRFEGYGMAYAEALAHGLPVIGTTAGAIPDTVPPNAGVLVEPNDVKALTRTLRMMIENPNERQWLASGAREAGAALPTWEESAKRLVDAIEALA
jgi:glycosyltransferase involved in cell wall biosynthesis